MQSWHFSPLPKSPDAIAGADGVAGMPGTWCRGGMERGCGAAIEVAAAEQVSPLLLLLPERRVITISVLEMKKLTQSA